ncbi:hypothetical protein BV379_15335 [Rhodovulum sulfidophilum]|nr:hypothetical protein BV379_15335 [Rhodovulum sulfidophilum]
MANWYSADLHFGHHRIIDFCKRPFASPEELEQMQRVARHFDVAGRDERNRALRQKRRPCQRLSGLSKPTATFKCQTVAP